MEMRSGLTILGAGLSGRAAARLAAAEGRGGQVVTEKLPPAPEIDELAAFGFSCRTALPDLLAEEILLSPGIPLTHPWFQQLRERQASGIPEFEWAARRLKGPQIAVTGSLGKTSMVLLAAALLREAGYTVTVSGNIAPPVSEVARTHPVADFHVLELSSFQLENLRSYRPDRALCLNLFPNHLDRHGDMKTYAEAKARLFACQQPGDLAVWPEDYPAPVGGKAARLRVESVRLPPLTGTPFASPALRLNLQGLFALLSGIPGIDPFRQEPVLREFQFPPHRMQVLSVPGAGRVVDDSKSTCLRASMAALSSVQGEVQLVMGGIDKGESLEEFLPLLRERNPRLYLFGRSAKKMKQAWQDSVDECLCFDTLGSLIPVLWEARTCSQILLFSPGCASFDQYESYAARGQHFQRLVAAQSATHPIY
ncbi:MAG: Mur ligase family protein [Kiritimatiellia bacterium]